MVFQRISVLANAQHVKKFHGDCKWKNVILFPQFSRFYTTTYGYKDTIEKLSRYPSLKVILCCCIVIIKHYNNG